MAVALMVKRLAMQPDEAVDLYLDNWPWAVLHTLLRRVTSPVEAVYLEVEERTEERVMAEDIVRALRRTRADMIGTKDEQHYDNCHTAADEIMRLRSLLSQARFYLPDGLPTGCGRRSKRRWRVARRESDADEADRGAA